MRPDMTSIRSMVLVAALTLAACAGNSTRNTATAEAEESAASIHLRLGQGYLEQGRLEIAQDRINRALAEEPRNPAAHTLMAVLQEKIGDEPRAGDHYRRAVDLEPKKGVYLQNYARWLCRAGRYEEAEAHFQRALADPFYDTPILALFNSAVCTLSTGDVEGAEERLRSVIQRQPNHAGALFQLATIQYRRGEFLRARAFLQRLESLTPLDADALVLGHRIEQKMGDTDASQNYLRRLQESFPDSEQARTLEPSEKS